MRQMTFNMVPVVGYIIASIFLLLLLLHTGSGERKGSYLKSIAALTKTNNTLRKEDFNIKVVIIGGTETAEFCGTVLGVTEVQLESFFSIDTNARLILGHLIDGKKQL